MLFVVKGLRVGAHNLTASTSCLPHLTAVEIPSPSTPMKFGTPSRWLEFYMSRSRFVSFISLLLMFLSSCGSGSARNIIDKDANLKQYTHVNIHQSEKASFIELELMEIFRKQGYKIVGSEEIVKNKTMGVRYLFETDYEYYEITCVFLDEKTQKTLASIEAKGGRFDFITGHVFPDRKKAKENLLKEICKVLPKITAGP